MNYGIGNVKGSGGVSNTMLTTTTDATENSGTYTLDLTYLSETPKVNDYVVYVNNGNLTTLYQVSAVGSTNATLEKIGDIGGGSGTTLYIHHITMKNSSDANRIVFSLVSNKATAYTSAEILQYLITNNMVYADATPRYNNAFAINGVFYNASNENVILYDMVAKDNTTFRCQGINGVSGASVNNVDITPSSMSIYDNIVELGTASINGGGKQLYLHNIDFYNANLVIHTTITNDSQTAFTKSTFKNYLDGKGRWMANGYLGTGASVSYNVEFVRMRNSALNISAITPTSLWENYIDIDTEFDDSGTTFSDNVYAL